MIDASDISSFTGVAQYRWDCTAQNDAGQWYIPSERDRNVDTDVTVGSELNIYHVQNLNANCHGEVTAIEYCYRYSRNAGQGNAVFNWTVLILEESGGNFIITNVYAIQSHPRLVSNENCTDVGGIVTCCDVTDIRDFALPMNFAFGVTEADQGNTHGATLLGFHGSLSQYRVATTLLSKAGLSLSVGSTVPIAPMVQRGLRMLWFVIGKSHVIYVVYMSHTLHLMWWILKELTRPLMQPHKERREWPQLSLQLFILTHSQLVNHLPPPHLQLMTHLQVPVISQLQVQLYTHSI